MNNAVTIKFMRDDPDSLLVLPSKAHVTDAGVDLYFANRLIIKWNEEGAMMVDTGLRIDIPDGFYGQIRPRSSAAMQGFFTNAGVIDSGYHGPIMVLMQWNPNISVKKPELDEQGLLDIGAGTSLFQLIIMPVVNHVVMLEVEEFKETERGEGGFGSSSKRKQEGCERDFIKRIKCKNGEGDTVYKSYQTIREEEASKKKKEEEDDEKTEDSEGTPQPSQEVNLN